MKLFFPLALTALISTPAHARYLEKDSTDPNTTPGPDSNRYIVVSKNSEGLATANAAASNVHTRFSGINGIAASLPSAAVDALSKNPNIAYVERDQRRYFDHLRGLKNNLKDQTRRLFQNIPYGISMVQADQVPFDPTKNVKVCVIDSGYDIGHPDLPSTTNGFDVSGYEGDKNLPWNEDHCGHGSHVAGTIAAVDNDMGVIGVAPGVDLFIVRVFGDDCGWAYSSSLIHAAEQCQAAGANIISMSLGGSFSSDAEHAVFNNLYISYNILNIAAAGNDGNTKLSYPASYDSVISVAAIDEFEALAPFSQRNHQVELAAPGVSIRSTLMGGVEGLVDADGSAYVGIPIEYAPLGEKSGALVHCGVGRGTDTCDATAKVCLIERGEISFYEKVKKCEDSGGIATIIYNNVPGPLLATLGDGYTTTITAIGVRQRDGHFLLSVASLGSSSRVFVGSTNYGEMSGTSMATPHVSGVAALVWSQFSTCTSAQIRKALADSAKDLGVEGRDNDFGYGLVQAKEAVNYLNAYGCSGNGGGSGGGGGTCGVVGIACSDGSECCSGKCKGKPGSMKCK